MVFDIAQVNMIKLVAKKFPAFRKLVWSIFFLIFDQWQAMGKQRTMVHVFQ